MNKALKNINNHAHDQKTQAREDQVLNNAGGFVFPVSPKDRIERFLILGTDGGTFYVNEKVFTEKNFDAIKSLITQDEALVRNVMVDVAVNNRAAKTGPTIFTAAMLHHFGVEKEELRAVLPLILRTSSHLFEYAEFVKNLGGWGRSKRNAVKDWYESKAPDQLAYQLVKYRQRNGWTHRDLLRLSHAQPDDVLARFALGKDIAPGEAPAVIEGFLAAQQVTTADEAIKVLTDYPMLTWESLPTTMHKNVDVWKTLFNNGSLKGAALLRNTVRLAKMDAFNDMDFASVYAERLASADAVKASRLHPVNYLNALVTYTEGQMVRHEKSRMLTRKAPTWNRSPVITEALNAGFHEAFGNVERSTKRTFIGLDVSGSMSTNANGMDISCAQVGAVMAMAIARTTDKYDIRGFTSGKTYYTAALTDLGITGSDSLENVMSKTRRLSFGGTDCSLPMTYALENEIAIDTFVVITDNETWAGGIQPFEALKQYRKAMGIDAKLAVLGVAATGFTIADPKDKGMMDFVGFDASAPRILSEFSEGRL